MVTQPANPLTKKITIPAFTIYTGRVGGSLISRLGNRSVVADVEISESEIKCFYLLKTNLSSPFNELLLKKPNTRLRDNAGKYCLQIKDNTSIDALDSSTKLQWIEHPQKNSNDSPNDIVSSWLGKFRFKEDLVDIGQAGLRKPQLGALHAISAHLSTDRKIEPATVVLPTGTGKTETMLCTLLYQRCNKVLVVVPSNALRDQISEKFLTLGYLQELGVTGFDTKMPYIAKLTKGIHVRDVVDSLIERSNVIVATASILQSSNQDLIDLLSQSCSHLFVDEAHHISANSWTNIKEKFTDKKVIQFTATPFRNDGKSLGGRIIYNYSMGEAQQAGYFMPINMVPIEEYAEDSVDVSIAETAVAKLREDLEAQLEHLLLVRVNTKERAQEVFGIYQGMAQDLNPIVMHSGLTKTVTQERLNSLRTFVSKIVVCVDMLGEGYDLPNLKIAAVHDHHKSLAITLQFIGRFIRTDRHQNIGEASVVVNIADPEIENELKHLYSQGADWDLVLRRLAENRIQKEIRLQEIVDALKTNGDLHKVISLWNIKPSFSAMLFSTTCIDWDPSAYVNDLPKFDDHWHAISEEERLLVILAINSSPVKWGAYKDLRDINYKLLIAHWNQESNALFVFSNDYNTFRVEKLATNLCGQSTAIFSGAGIFNIFNGIELPLVRNLGGSQIGAISFTQFFGSNVTEGLGRIAAAELNLSNIATIGYEDGNKVLWGCSEKKGKIWSPQACNSISDWCEWVDHAWLKISQGGIDQENITRDFLKPEKISTRYEQFPVSVQWGEYIQSSYEDTVEIIFGDIEIPFYLVSLSLDDPSETGHLRIRISNEERASVYELRLGEQSPNFEYELIAGDSVSIARGRKEAQDFIDYMNTDPLYINYIDGSFSYNCFLIRVHEAIGLYPADDLKVGEWAGIDIRRESMGKNRIQNTVQYRAYQSISENYDIIFNDDGSGEAADLIALKLADDEIILELVHCKYSSSENPGGRVSDLYEVCGQAQRSIRWKHLGFMALYKRIKHREKLWNRAGNSRFLKGTLKELTNIKNRARKTPLRFKVSIVQPGASAAQVTQEMLRLLGSTAQYIKKTTEADLEVVVSE